MVKRRKLSNEEKKLINGSLVLLQEESEDAGYMVDYFNLMIDRGIDINIKRQLREYKNKRREAKNAVDTNNKAIEILKDQLKNGVEIKKLKTEEK